MGCFDLKVNAKCRYLTTKLVALAADHKKLFVVILGHPWLLVTILNQI